jgi:hypothetical protein
MCCHDVDVEDDVDVDFGLLTIPVAEGKDWRSLVVAQAIEGGTPSGHPTQSEWLP